MPYKLVKTICQAHYVKLDDDGNVVGESVGDPVARYGREQHNSFIDDCERELADLEAEAA